MFFRCRGCGVKIALQDIVESIDEEVERILANMPCDRF
ncbi:MULTISPECIES: dual CXXC motif small (seleno)protein [Desulfosalsimonas]